MVFRVLVPRACPPWWSRCCTTAAATQLRQLGFKPRSTDLIVFLRQAKLGAALPKKRMRLTRSDWLVDGSVVVEALSQQVVCAGLLIHTVRRPET